ncbi:hypothetical protein EYM_07245 [Ignicoccus islandicus DSM 13165]|uniref:Uncharacterized protein n=1 Tax=Ignicoccus islandicus DSM 13165 TaxID=940295 RepID=A0A0U3F9Q8_9CREN|nr:hypothetical protein [Ignicoccus islandicus]ALU12760.1 hypothetical protein EYM_07245 [Ignicoccus islandicus DSM 13165]
MPVLLQSIEELNERVLSKPNKNIVECKVTKGAEKSKVKVKTARKMYVIIVPTNELDKVLNEIKEKSGCEAITIFE